MTVYGLAGGVPRLLAWQSIPQAGSAPVPTPLPLSNYTGDQWQPSANPSPSALSLPPSASYAAESNLLLEAELATLQAQILQLEADLLLLMQSMQRDRAVSYANPPAPLPPAPVAPLPPAPPPPPPPAPVADNPAPQPPAQPPTSKPDFYATREQWFISQTRTAKYNSKEDTPRNGNCGPTSLTMVAKAFGKINPSAAQANDAIEESRRRMGGGTDEQKGTSSEGMVRGAQSYGLDAFIKYNVTLQDIKDELAKGRLVIINGNYINHAGQITTGHHYVCTKIEGDKAYLNDPAFTEPRVVSTKLLMESIYTHFGHRFVSVGPGKP